MKHHTVQSRGFTLIELLVTISIFIVLTGVVLAKYRTFDKNAGFANVSEDIVLMLRQAQVYGVSAKAAAGSFTNPYGVQLRLGGMGPLPPIFFSDLDGDEKFSGGDLFIELMKWPSNVSVASLNCNGAPCVGVMSLSVTFKRPNPGAIIKDNNGNTYDQGGITITNGTKTSTVNITKAGQISLQ